MTIPEGKKVYFSSDNHLGAPTKEASNPREAIFVKWLDEIKHDAAAIFLLGDLFDFWFEYKHAVPKGFVRVMGKLAELKDGKEEGLWRYFDENGKEESFSPSCWENGEFVDCDD